MKKSIILCAVLASMVQFSFADEGMWMLTDLKTQNAVVMKDLGLEMNIEDVYSTSKISLKDAVVHFGGGCTGEVISQMGLVLTNHHCGYSYIQQHSTLEHDYLTDGFWAMKQEDELPCKGLAITFIDKILDVTDYVMERLSKDPDPQGTNYLSPSYLATVAEKFAKKEKIKLDDFTSLELKAFYGGNRYYMFVNKTYRDIRMVGAPPSSIGKFGADTDNWMWPRHTGDFSLFRIYATKDGQPCEYSKDNVPFKPKRHIKLCTDGVKEGDFAFIMGFPGRNWRYMIEDEVEERMATTNFMRKVIRTIRLEKLDEKMSANPKNRIQYAAKYASSANYWKNAIGMNEGLVGLNVLDTKKKMTEELLMWGKDMGTDRYQKAYDKIREIVKDRWDDMYNSQCLLEACRTATEFYSIPATAKFVKALKSGDEKAISEEASNLRSGFEKFFDRNYDPDVDRSVSKACLGKYAELTKEKDRIDIFDLIRDKYEGSVDKFVDACFDTSVFSSTEAFEKFMSNPDASVLENDLMVLYRSSVMKKSKELSDRLARPTDEYNAAHKVWVDGMMKLYKEKGRKLYPDANSTLRLSYGKVGPYSPKDAVTYNWFTTLDGVMEKENPAEAEFTVPARLKELYEKKDFGPYAREDGKMPVCFVSGLDTTGGNSGSPIFNARGELIGTNFDRNYEALSGDIAYQTLMQRSIAVDIRYTLFIIDKYAGCSRIISELGLR